MKPDAANRLRTGLALAGWTVLLAAALWAACDGVRAAAARLILFATVGPYFVYCLFTAALWLSVILRRRESVECRGEDILIIAPHQDDCVAMAGGYAIRTLEMGGRVTVLYATDGFEDGRDFRRLEALDAWRVAGLGADRIHFMDYPGLRGFTGRAELDRCTGEIEGWIREVRPGTIFIPLYEGGHYQHDAVNYMVSAAARRTGFKGAVYEAPEYNFFLSFRTTPEKILSGFMRFIPLVRHDYPPEAVTPDALLHLEMTPREIEKKKEMLSRFKTQHPDQLVLRFGFEDRYQPLHAYDYRRPPFDYGRSAARTLDRLKAMPLVGGPVSKMFKWTRTIHPDRDYFMTRIPGV
jgi:LmbE family N-acetylglucosaminyl deacetylase